MRKEIICHVYYIFHGNIFTNTCYFQIDMENYVHNFNAYEGSVAERSKALV